MTFYNLGSFWDFTITGIIARKGFTDYLIPCPHFHSDKLRNLWDLPNSTYLELKLKEINRTHFQKAQIRCV